MSFSLQGTLFGFLLFLAQLLAALPWLAVLNWSLLAQARARQAGKPGRGIGTGVLLGVLVALVVGGLAMTLLLAIVQDTETLKNIGRVYGALLQLQLSADLLVLAFGVLQLVWPKGAAVAVAAFREGVRQPMILLLFLFALVALLVSPYIPYWTFGEDHKMLEEVGYDTIMFVALLFGTLAASMSISEEIEGRTAITLMSKPVSRRQFLLGKFVGILMAALAMTLLLGWVFDWVLLYKRWYDTVEAAVPPTPLTGYVQAWLTSGNLAELFRGIELWGIDATAAMPGLVLGFCQVMVLLAVAVSLATRLPMVINLTICLGVYFLGHLTPALLEIARDRSIGEAGTVILDFMAKLFYFVLPGLDYFSLGTSVVRDNPLPLGSFLLYVASVVGYAVMYTLIVLVFGLILFEDRDLA
jgi:ABC-type transport system involved in multi-copper enzyme maturation permease subunit